MSTPGACSDDLDSPTVGLGLDLEPMTSLTSIAETLTWPTDGPPGVDRPYSILPLQQELETAWEKSFPKGFDKVRADDWDELKVLCEKFSEKERWLVLGQLPLRWQARAFLCIASSKNEQLINQADQDNKRKRKREEESAEVQISSIATSSTTSETDLDTETHAHLESGDDTIAQFISLQLRYLQGDELLRTTAKKHKEDQQRARSQVVTLKARHDELLDQLQEQQERARATEVDNAAKAEQISDLQKGIQNVSATNDALMKQHALESQEAVKTQALIANLEMETTRLAKVISENEQLRKEIKAKDDRADDLRRTNHILRDQYDRAKAVEAEKQAILPRLEREKQTLEKEKHALEQEKNAQDTQHKKAFATKVKALRAEQAKCETLESELWQTQEVLDGITQAVKAAGQLSSPGLRTPASRKKSR